MTTNYAGRLSAVSKSFGDTTVLSNASFSIPAGKFVVLLGPNGSGKTTSVRLLTGLLSPNKGEVELLGEHVNQQNADKLRARIGVQTDGGLYDRLTAYENLDLWGELYGVDPAKRKAKIEEIFDFFGLGERRNTPVGAFSKGMRQQIALGRALIHDPELLIIDEPTSGLDPLMADKFLHYVHNLQRTTGMSVLMATHRLEMVDEIANEVVILNHGCIRLQKSVDELLGEGVKRVVVTPENLQLPELDADAHRQSLVAAGLWPLIAAGQRMYEATVPLGELANHEISAYLPLRRSIRDIYAAVIEGESNE
ncbi:MAG: ABC transporter ATP-binding protein [Corynebacterium sp.]|nr:ABC transporter ATP-binding protein [Corynebacterium sp.]